MNYRTRFPLRTCAVLSALWLGATCAALHAEDAAPATDQPPDAAQSREKQQAERDARQTAHQAERDARQVAQQARQQAEQEQGQRDREQRQQQRDQLQQQQEQKRQQAEKRLEEAQKQLERSAQEVAMLNLSLNDNFGKGLQIDVGGPVPRVQLGINIAMTDRDGAKPDQGVRVLSVSPGGPAEVAGLKSNDFVVSFNGKALVGEQGRLPQRQLLILLADAKPGASVPVEYRRDDKLVKTQITPRAVPAPAVMPDVPDMAAFGNGHAFKFNWNWDGGGLGSADLVELSPGLGKYFGTDKGLLVVRAPRDERLRLQDGDVILDIDGRVPKGVAHASQILGSYHAGETLKLHIMRQQKRIELPVEIPVDAGPSAFFLAPVDADRA